MDLPILQTNEVTMGERASEGASSDWTLKHHLARYRFALQYTSGQRVLDVACGPGYGVQMVAGHGNLVTAVEFSWDAVSCAAQDYAYGDLSLTQGGGTRLPFRDASLHGAF